MMKKSQTLLVTAGDPGGIGPEVTWKALQRVRFPSGIKLLVVGAESGFKKIGLPVRTIPYVETHSNLQKHSTLSAVEGDSILKLATRYRAGDPLPLICAPEKLLSLKGFHLGGFQSGWSISLSVRALLAELNKPSITLASAALVTGPISKENLIAGGFPFPGHTEMLAYLVAQKGNTSLTKKTSRAALSRVASPVTPKVTMMLANEVFRVSLVSTHVSIKNVPKMINKDSVFRAGKQTYDFLINQLGIQNPKIGVLGLNPHAGEHGLFGLEETRFIIPAIQQLNKMTKKSHFFGPYPADTYFALQSALPKHARHDAVLAMYHDQGLIPAKLVSFDKTVNLTLGLPFIRTSVDHGTAFDIAGKNRADPSSMISALEQAAHFLEISGK